MFDEFLKDWEASTLNRRLEKFNIRLHAIRSFIRTLQFYDFLEPKMWRIYYSSTSIYFQPCNDRRYVALQVTNAREVYLTYGGISRQFQTLANCDYAILKKSLMSRITVVNNA